MAAHDKKDERKDEAKPASRLVTLHNVDYEKDGVTERAVPGTKVSELGLSAEQVKALKESGSVGVPQSDEDE